MCRVVFQSGLADQGIESAALRGCVYWAVLSYLELQKGIRDDFRVVRQDWPNLGVKIVVRCKANQPSGRDYWSECSATPILVKRPCPLPPDSAEPDFLAVGRIAKPASNFSLAGQQIKSRASRHHRSIKIFS